jgi:hypothetical protein
VIKGAAPNRDRSRSPALAETRSHYSASTCHRPHRAQRGGRPWPWRGTWHRPDRLRSRPPCDRVAVRPAPLGSSPRLESGRGSGWAARRLGDASGIARHQPPTGAGAVSGGAPAPGSGAGI